MINYPRTRSKKGSPSNFVRLFQNNMNTFQRPIIMSVHTNALIDSNLAGMSDFEIRSNFNILPVLVYRSFYSRLREARYSFRLRNLTFNIIWT